MKSDMNCFLINNMNCFLISEVHSSLKMMKIEWWFKDLNKQFTSIFEFCFVEEL